MKTKCLRLEQINSSDKLILSLVQIDNKYEISVFEPVKEVRLEHLIVEDIDDGFFFFNKYKKKYSKIKYKNNEKYINFVNDYASVFKLCEKEFMDINIEEELIYGLAIDLKKRIDKKSLLRLIENTNLVIKVVENLIYLSVPYSVAKKSQYDFMAKEMKKLNYTVAWYSLI